MNSFLAINSQLQKGRYSIKSTLGRGGFGITYKAITDKGDEVAIKELFLQGVNDRIGKTITISNASNRQMFFRQKEKFMKEARRIQSVSNEYIVHVYDAFEENDTAYYVMQLIHGKTLSEHLKEQGTASEYDAGGILIDMLSALDAIHEKKIWHLDIKPDNIILDENGRAILIDFGASKHIDINGSLTTSSSLAMTPAFAAPEQMRGDMTKFGPWTDFYALGGDTI